ncbi:putative RNA-directed DNA polymerase, eukaryota, reverse transcriptase zinc-binding domain protein [Tanacetum coccineum]
MERGVRQGDPLSPFIYLVAAECLNVTLKDAIRTGLYKGVKIGTSDIPISHLQYVDDTLIFEEWKESKARNLMRIMKCVKQASSLKINSNKTKLYVIGVHNEEVEGLANQIGCLAGKMPFTYLGNGNRTLIWLDSWIGDGVVLNEKFPRLYRLEINKDITVGDKKVWRNDTWDWRWDWAGELRGRGLEDFKELSILTNFIFPNVLQEYSWKWIHDDDGAFIVKKLREMVDDKILNRTIGTQETKWCKIVPRNVCIFIWRLQRRRLPVYTWLDHLVMDLNSILCPHCGNDIETMDHCFLGCSRVIDSWGKLFKW